MVKNVPAVLLVGGLGTRLRSVLPRCPKPLATIGDIPFLELLVRQLKSQGFRRVLMCTGFLADKIEQEFGDGKAFGVQIEYSREAIPLGTAGALRLARTHLAGTSDFFVLNGDSFIEMNFNELLQFHDSKNALLTIAVRAVNNIARYGAVKLDPQGRITEFREKNDATTSGLVNAGVYVMKREVLERIPDGEVSLERDILPNMLSQGLYALQQQGTFIDIGTPSDLARAQSLSAHLKSLTEGSSVSSARPSGPRPKS